VAREGPRCLRQKVAQKSSFQQHMIYGDILQITKTECVEERYAQSKAKIQFVQHCATTSATAELLLNIPPAFLHN